MSIIFKPLATFNANRVSTGDTHDLSIEYILKNTGFNAYLVTKNGEQYVVTSGVIVTAETKKEEVKSEIKSRQKKDAPDGRRAGRASKRTISRKARGGTT